MTKGMRGEQSSTRRALDESLLDQKRLDDFLDGVTGLRQNRRDCFHTDRSTAVIECDRGKVATVHGVEAGGVNLKLAKGAVGGGAVDATAARNQREVAHAPQQPSGNARCAA